MLRQLIDIFDQLPPIDINGSLYKPIFRFGTRGQLAEDLSLKRKTGERYYPLVYLETPFVSDEIVTLRLILATLNRRVEMRNYDRLKYTFEDVLEPLRDNVIHALLRSGVFRKTTETPDPRYYKGEYFFNYHIEPDIWDALVYETTLRYDNSCQVSKIYFKTETV